MCPLESKLYHSYSTQIPIMVFIILMNILFVWHKNLNISTMSLTENEQYEQYAIDFVYNQ